MPGLAPSDNRTWRVKEPILFEASHMYSPKISSCVTGNCNNNAEFAIISRSQIEAGFLQDGTMGPNSSKRCRVKKSGLIFQVFTNLLDI